MRHRLLDRASFILGATFALIFVDDNGIPTDVDRDGRADVAFREICNSQGRAIWTVTTAFRHSPVDGGRTGTMMAAGRRIARACRKDTRMHTSRHLIAAAVAAGFAAILVAPALDACTTFCVASGGRVIFGRNYDFDFGRGMMVVNPRGLLKSAMVTGGASLPIGGRIDDAPELLTGRHGATSVAGRDATCAPADHRRRASRAQWLFAQMWQNEALSVPRMARSWDTYTAFMIAFGANWSAPLFLMNTLPK